MAFHQFFLKCVLGFLLLAVVLLYLPGIPPAISFSAFRLEPARLREGALATNTILDKAERSLEGTLIGPESIASRARNEIFVGLLNGNIVRIWGHGFEKNEVVAKFGTKCAGLWEDHICGRPLGMRFSPDRRLIIADAYLGIFTLDLKTGNREQLVDADTPIGGLKPRTFNDLDIDTTGNIYWSDSSTNAILSDGMIELFADPSGRLLKYDESSKRSEVLLSNLHFANGVQLSPNEDFLLVSESFRYRILRYWLKGPKAGTSDVFISGLPGMPDNIRARRNGGFYVPLVINRHPEYPDLYQKLTTWPSIRKILIKLFMIIQNIYRFINSIFPNELSAKIIHKIFHLSLLAKWNDFNETIVVEVDQNGSIIGSLQGSNGTLKSVSEVVQVGDYLFFGSPFSSYLGRLHINETEENRGKYMETGDKADAAFKSDDEETRHNEHLKSMEREEL